MSTPDAWEHHIVPLSRWHLGMTLADLMTPAAHPWKDHTMTTTDDLADAAQVAELHRQNEEFLARNPVPQYASEAEADFLRGVDARRAQARSLAGTVDVDKDRMSRAVAAMVDASTGTTKDPATWWQRKQQREHAESVPTGPESRPSEDTAGALKTSQRATGGVSAGGVTVDPYAQKYVERMRENENEQQRRRRSVDAVLHQSPTTTPEFGDARPRGDVPGLRPNPGMLRALLQPVLFLKLEEPVGAFEKGDVVAAQFWGEGRVMMTPLPAAAAKGRIPTTFPANKIHAVIAGPVPKHYDTDVKWVEPVTTTSTHTHEGHAMYQGGPREGTDAYDVLHPLS